MDSTRPLLASESVRASHSEACSPFLMGSSLWKTSSVITVANDRPNPDVLLKAPVCFSK